ncbi:VOC family protein [Nocardia thraciensis]
MKVSGPDFIGLQVRDVAAAASFYEDRLGLRRAAVSPPGAVVFDTTPIPFAIRGPLPGVDLDAAAPRPGLGIALWLQVDDASALHDALAAAGTPIVTEMADSPFGRHFAFADPEGYVITVHEGD